MPQRLYEVLTSPHIYNTLSVGGGVKYNNLKSPMNIYNEYNYIQETKQKILLVENPPTALNMAEMSVNWTKSMRG